MYRVRIGGWQVFAEARWNEGTNQRKVCTRLLRSIAQSNPFLASSGDFFVFGQLFALSTD
jgi:hypothetical protein